MDRLCGPPLCGSCLGKIVCPGTAFFFVFFFFLGGGGGGGQGEEGGRCLRLFFSFFFFSCRHPPPGGWLEAASGNHSTCVLRAGLVCFFVCFLLLFFLFFFHVLCRMSMQFFRRVRLVRWSHFFFALSLSISRMFCSFLFSPLTLCMSENCRNKIWRWEIQRTRTRKLDFKGL